MCTSKQREIKFKPRIKLNHKISMYFVGSQKKLKRAHYEIQDIQPVFFYVTLNLHKTETSLRQTVGVSLEGVCLIELVDCIESGKVFFSYYNVFCMNKRCVAASNYVSFFRCWFLQHFFPHQMYLQVTWTSWGYVVSLLEKCSLSIN